ncbi:MAG: hypothetical protein GY931_19705 [Maribacter sp.]|nr:hypothetical protein [Maribacter sp.]
MISTFELQEAVSLINKTVTKKGTKVASTTDIGIISGVLAMNDQIELVIKFENILDQSTKDEFYERYTFLEKH